MNERFQLNREQVSERLLERGIGDYRAREKAV